MKKIILPATLALIIASTGFSVEKQMVNRLGERIFKCDSTGGGGKIRVKAISKNKFRIIGSIYSGIIKADSFFTAARIGCGEKENE